MKPGDWVRVSNPARGTYLKTGFVTHVSGIPNIAVSITVRITGDDIYLYMPDELELFNGQTPTNLSRMSRNNGENTNSGVV